MLKQLNKTLHTPTWLFILLVVVMVFRIPSFFEPYSYGDEMIYLALGEAIRQRIPLYSGIHDNKPPLLYIMAAIGGSLFWFKAILAIWHLVTVYLFWKFVEKLFPNKPTLHKAATAIFALFTTIPLLEGNIANAELFMVGPTILGFYILLNKKLNFKNIILAGFSFSVATLFKVPAAFDVGAIVFYWLATNKFNIKNLKKIIINTSYLLVGFSIPILATILWYYMRGAFTEYIIAAFLQNVGYLSSWRPDDVKEPFLVKNAPLLKRAGVVALGHIIIFWKRHRLSKQFILLTSWLLLALFAITLSERPYPHYLIQAITPISILAAMLFTLKSIEQVLVIIPLTLAALTPVYYDFWRYETLPYYTKFVKFTTNKITKEEYLSTFGGNVIRNYKISRFIVSSTEKTDKIFIWGDGSAIYALSKRLPPIKYVADYHIRDFSSKEDVFKKISGSEPKLIIILPNSGEFEQLDNYLTKTYIKVDEIDGAEMWKLLKPSVRKIMNQ
jgi:4-amino-4-deoxy-L-arabinose transferase-like glycosyltransferase